MRPTDVNGINKAAGEYYHLVYNNVFGVRACSLRLTNVYGPRQLIRHNRQGFIGWFIRLAIEDGTIQIYGDGSQLRDFVYVDDAADAFLRAGASDACNGEVFNVGGDRADQPSRSDDAAGRRRRHRARRVRRVAAGEEGDRHRQLLRRLDASSRARPAGRRPCRCATACAARSRSTAQHFDRYVDRAAPARSARDRAAHPVPRARAAATDAAAVRAAIDRVVASGWFVLGPEVEAFEARVRRGVAARRTPSASATAPTRSR